MERLLRWRGSLVSFSTASTRASRWFAIFSGLAEKVAESRWGPPRFPLRCLSWGMTCFTSAPVLPRHSAGITETTWWKGSRTQVTIDTTQRSQLFTWTGMCDHVGFARFVSFKKKSRRVLLKGATLTTYYPLWIADWLSLLNSYESLIIWVVLGILK